MNVLDFEDDDLLLVEHSPDIQDWTLADLREAAPLDSVFDADAVICSNWVSTPAMGDGFHELADEDLRRDWFVFDPSDVLGSDLSGHDALREAVAALQSTLSVVVSVNRTELHALAAALPDPPDPQADDRDRVRALHEAVGGAAVVKHGEEEALAATEAGVVAVDNPTVEDQRQTGGGDRFAGALAVGLGAGWSWDVALACGNACASYYVATGETATAEELRAWMLE